MSEVTQQPFRPIIFVPAHLTHAFFSHVSHLKWTLPATSCPFSGAPESFGVPRVSFKTRLSLLAQGALGTELIGVRAREGKATAASPTLQTRRPPGTQEGPVTSAGRKLPVAVWAGRQEQGGGRSCLQPTPHSCTDPESAGTEGARTSGQACACSCSVVSLGSSSGSAPESDFLLTCRW